MKVELPKYKAILCMGLIVLQLVEYVRAGIYPGGCPKLAQDATWSSIADGTYYLNYFDEAYWGIHAFIYTPMQALQNNPPMDSCTTVTTA